MVGLAAAGAAACEEERKETSILSSIFCVGPASVLATWQVAPTKPRPRRRHWRARAKRVDTPGTMAALRARDNAVDVGEAWLVPPATWPKRLLGPRKILKTKSMSHSVPPHTQPHLPPPTPPRTMAFWGLKVEPNKWTPFVPPPEEALRLHISQVRS